MVRYKIKPKFYIDSETRTVALQNKSTGKLFGRRATRKGERSDMTHPIRNSETGEIFGRAPRGITKIQVHGSSHSRGTTRTLRRQL